MGGCTGHRTRFSHHPVSPKLLGNGVRSTERAIDIDVELVLRYHGKSVREFLMSSLRSERIASHHITSRGTASHCIARYHNLPPNHHDILTVALRSTAVLHTPSGIMDGRRQISIDVSVLSIASSTSQNIQRIMSARALTCRPGA